MSITDELRKEARGFGRHAYTAPQADCLTAIADRIDERHREECEERYAAGVESVPIALDKSQWVKLPVDDDGVPIRIGDTMEWFDGSTAEVIGIGDGVFFYVEDGEDCADWTVASTKRHHVTTVENVLREFAEKIIDSQIPSMHPTYEEAIAEYAAKLRLAGDAE